MYYNLAFSSWFCIWPIAALIRPTSLVERESSCVSTTFLKFVSCTTSSVTLIFSLETTFNGVKRFIPFIFVLSEFFSKGFITLAYIVSTGVYFIGTFDIFSSVGIDDEV